MVWEGHVVEIEGCGMKHLQGRKSLEESAEGMECRVQAGLAPVSEGFIEM